MGFENPVVGGTALRIPAIQSPNYTPGTAGWIIEIDGSAEFNNLTVRGVFLGSNFILNAAGLFIYSGTPANGNLIASIAPAAGTDTYANTYFEGVVSYSGSAFMGLAAANLLLGIITDPTNAAVVGISGIDTLFVSSPASSGRPDLATIALVDGDDTTTPLSSSAYPHVDVGAATAGTTGWINGAWVHSSVSGGTSTADVWQVVGSGGASAYNANWQSSSTFNGSTNWQGLRYRIDAEDNLWVLGCFKTGAVAGGASVFQLPAAYRPSVQWPIPVSRNNGGTLTTGMGQISAAGNLNLLASSPVPPVANAEYLINGKVPLGNVA